MGRMNEKVVIVTGGNSGVGKAAALRLAKEGAKLVISARRADALEAAAEEIRAAGGEVTPVVCDISKPEDAKRLVETAVSTYGKLDVLVNNAGVLESGLKPIDRVEDEALEKVIAINEKGTIYCMREATQVMRDAGNGSIVNVASVAGVLGCGGAAYVATKAAIVGITRHTALRFAGQGVRCNAICPGTIVTPMTMASKADHLDPDMMGQMMKHSDLKVRPCMADDVANIILFFASDESAAITGQAIVSDFGASL
jgi:NAD(P)-dependent dehydrogenase (short-subunit alcohol dehydrogenase family)